jgi:septum formation protein
MAPVLGSDTLCLLNGEVLEKPRDEADAISMLLRMAGREHSVLTAVCVADGQRQCSKVSETRVRFRAFDRQEAIQYWQTGEPADKAGAYGIQGRGAALVEHMEGSYSGVVGLPIETLLPLLEMFNIAVWQTELGNS